MEVERPTISDLISLAYRVNNQIMTKEEVSHAISMLVTAYLHRNKMSKLEMSLLVENHLSDFENKLNRKSAIYRGFITGGSAYLNSLITYGIYCYINRVHQAYTEELQVAISALYLIYIKEELV
jgi:hypothetical protein